MDPIMLQGIFGGVQALGSLFVNDSRPKYEVPPALRQAVSLAQMRARDPMMPGQALMYEQNQLAAANSLEAAKNAGALNESISRVTAGLTKANQEVNVLAQRDQKQDEQELTNILGKLADAQNMEFEINKLGPAKDRYNEKRDMFGAGITNIFKSLESQQLVDLIKSIQ